jgi:LmbE family N-acetylglucosaminyl deacetylase
VAEVWLSAVASGSPDVTVVDVTDTADRKLAALRCHRSQYSDWDALEERVRGWLEATAKANGLEPGRLAEQFVVVPTA